MITSMPCFKASETHKQLRDSMHQMLFPSTLPALDDLIRLPLQEMKFPVTLCIPKRVFFQARQNFTKIPTRKLRSQIST